MHNLSRFGGRIEWNVGSSFDEEVDSLGDQGTGGMALRRPVVTRTIRSASPDEPNPRMVQWAAIDPGGETGIHAKERKTDKFAASRPPFGCTRNKKLRCLVVYVLAPTLG